jgi:hypothetical protein
LPKTGMTVRHKTVTILFNDFILRNFPRQIPVDFSPRLGWRNVCDQDVNTG